MWLNLVVLRDNIASLFSSTASTSDAESSVWVPLTLPDPLPAPLSAAQNTRSLRSVRPVGVSEDIVNVVYTAQMIPVIISLIHSVLGTANIREEIDQGVRDARDIARDAKEATRIENDRWNKERKDMENISKDKVNKNEVTFLSCIYSTIFMVIKICRIKPKQRHIKTGSRISTMS